MPQLKDAVKELERLLSDLPEPDRGDRGLTRVEICEKAGWSDRRWMREKRRMVAVGKWSVGQGYRKDDMGRLFRVPVYRPKR